MSDSIRTIPLFGKEEASAGATLRDKGIADVLAADTAVHRSYAQHAREVIDQFIAEGRTFTADDVRAEIPDGIDCHHPNVLPAVFGDLSRKERIVRVGDYFSTRRSRHRGRASVWRGVA